MNQKIKTIFSVAKPWLIAGIILVLLKVTGGLANISAASNQVLLYTGLRDAEIDGTLNKEFNYNFTLQDLEGKTIDFNSFKGKVVFVNIWATWCGPCRAEMPSIQKLHTKLQSTKNIAFVMLSIDQDGHQAKVKSYLGTKKFTFPVFMPSGYLPQQFQVNSIPTTFIIDKSGKIVMQKTGVTNFDTPKFERYLLELANR